MATTSGDRDRHLQRFALPFEYPVCFTRGLFGAGNPTLVEAVRRLEPNRRHRALVYIDGGVAAATPDIAGAIERYARAHGAAIELARPPEVVAGGEAAKNGWAPVQRVMTAIGDAHLCRQSFIIAVGGGAVLDMVGFAASIVHRGLRMIRVPTTVLAQNDAGVGVKNGMNEHGMKNFVGTFAPPFAVLVDFDFLRTLEGKHWIGGIAEAFKVAIIKDAEFFAFLEDRAEALRSRDEAAMETAVRRCALLHLEHIATSGDPFEFGSARPLDFGHWASHRLEVMSRYALGHGQAVAVGIALDAAYAFRAGRIAANELERILGALGRCGLPVWSPLLEERDAAGRLAILRGLDDFREHLGGELTVTLPDGIGRKVEVHEMGAAAIEDAVADLNGRFGA